MGTATHQLRQLELSHPKIGDKMMTGVDVPITEISDAAASGLRYSTFPSIFKPSDLFIKLPFQRSHPDFILAV